MIRSLVSTDPGGIPSSSSEEKSGGGESDQEPPTEREISLLASTRDTPLPEDFISKANVDEGSKAELSRVFAQFQKAPTIMEIKQHFRSKVEVHERAI